MSEKKCAAHLLRLNGHTEVIELDWPPPPRYTQPVLDVPTLLGDCGKVMPVPGTSFRLTSLEYKNLTATYIEE